MGFVLQFLYVCCLIFSTMASPNVVDFFPEIGGNLSKVTWAHAVNSKALLNKTLENNTIMMIEADISIGSTDNETNTTIMAHPPNIKSDLTLKDFLFYVENSNKKSSNKKGIKLDFKSTNALEKSVDILKNYTGNGIFPVWINADIIPGPINSTIKAVDATSFFSLTRNISNTIISIGWTTDYGPNMTGQYEKSHVDAMLSAIKANNVTKEITFPVRAGLAAQSLNEMIRLLSEVKNSTLTLWSSENDNVNITKLNNLLSEIGPKKLYIDVPESLRIQLSFNGNGTQNTTTTNTTYIPSYTTSPASNTNTTGPHTNHTTKAPINSSANMLRFGTLSLLFGVMICLL